jgi:hypothetical protein
MYIHYTETYIREENHIILKEREKQKVSIASSFGPLSIVATHQTIITTQEGTNPFVL